jgi:FMN phosphatase YigB (HAD superfamily)
MVEIKRELGLDDLEMALFFDDNENNVAPAQSLGVFVYLVGVDGLSRKAVFQGLSQFEESKLKAVLNEPRSGFFVVVGL